MKPLSQHIKEDFSNDNNSLKEALEKELMDEEFDALSRISPKDEVKRDNSKGIDLLSTVSGK